MSDTDLMTDSAAPPADTETQLDGDPIYRLEGSITPGHYKVTDGNHIVATGHHAEATAIRDRLNRGLPTPHRHPAPKRPPPS